MWPFRIRMWLHERHGGYPRTEEQRQPDHRASRGGRANHGDTTGQARCHHRLECEDSRNGSPDRERHGQARERLSASAKTDQAPWTRADRRSIRLRRPSLSLYLDTSALVKLLVDEPGSDLAREAFRNASLASASALGYVEAVSALTRSRNADRISAARFEASLDELKRIWSAIDIHAVTTEVIEDATQAVVDHELRAYDSLHLATALAVAKVEHVTFACWDHELRDAAQELGIPLLPAEL